MIARLEDEKDPISKDVMKINNATAFSTLNGPKTVSTKLYVVSSNSVGNWKTSLAGMSEDPSASIKSSIVLMVLKMANLIVWSMSKCRRLKPTGMENQWHSGYIPKIFTTYRKFASNETSAITNPQIAIVM